MAQLSKKDLVDRVATATDTSKAEAEKAFDGVIDVIYSALERGEEVNIHQFGKFSFSEQQERQGRNPSTGETITIKAQRLVKFKPSSTLKEAVKNHH